MIENLISDIVLAFFGALGHCFFMCGGFVAAFNKNKNTLSLNISYHLSKTASYVILGLIFSSFGSVLAFSSTSKGLIYFGIGIFMVVFGIAFFTRGKLLQIFEKNEIILKFLLKLSQKLSRLKGFKKAFALGFINGFLPCGLVYFFLAKAMTKNLLNGALLMMILGLVTMFVMIFFSLFLGFLKDNFAKVFLGFSSFIIIFNGLYYSYIGLGMTR